MEPSFWHERWQLKEIGFHQAGINPLLLEYWRGLIGEQPSGPVFVPLCGKSLDMLWLREQGHSVIGVELSAIAVDEFFQEQGLLAKSGVERSLEYREAEEIRLFCADFFALDPTHIGTVQAVYDRAALIALPLPLQERYVQHLLELLPHHPPILLIALDYDQTEMEGPPFSTPQERIRELFEGSYNVKLLKNRDVLEEHAGLKKRGLKRLTECVYVLSRR